jgi:hypothetical protein
MKNCTKCSNQKPLSEYNKNKKRKDGLSAWCKSCTKLSSAKWYKINANKVIARSRQWALSNQEKKKLNSRKSHLKRKYNMSLEDEKKLIDNQKNKCAICNIEMITEQSKFHIDHCHNSGKVRGVLCNSCNTGLGMFKDSQEYLKSAVKYLKKHQK